MSVPWTASDAQTPSSESASISATETILRIGSLDFVDHLNPNVGYAEVSHIFYGLVYDSLFSVGNDLETVGNLASSWWAVPETDPELVISGEPYGSVWEYNITPNARWHDGEIFTVDDVVWNINLNADYFEWMWAYQPYSYFLDYAEAVDADTVRIHYFERSTGSPMPVAFGDSLQIYMLPKHLMDEWTPSDIAFYWHGLFSEEESPGHPIVGTGPFTATTYIMDEYVEGDHITLVRNPEYHWFADRGLSISFDKIIMKFYDDPVGMSADLENGLLDVAQFPPQTYKELKEDIDNGELEDMDCYDGIKCTQYWTEIGFNMKDAGPNPSRLDPAVRQAMAMGTDKEFIKDTYYNGFADVGTTLISPVNTKWHYEPTADELFPFDTAAAAELLDEAGYRIPLAETYRVVTEDSLAYTEGWAEVGDRLTYDMLVRREYPEELLIANYLAQVWREELGLELVPRVVDEVVLATEVYNYNYDMVLWFWGSDPDPNYILFCQSERAWGGWSDNLYYNETYEQSYNSSVSAMDPVEREEYVDNCQLVHYRDAAYIILAYVHQTYIWRTDTFTGWGDWANDPGRSLDAYWGANPLLFDLVPTTPGNSPPADLTLVTPTGDAYVDEALSFTVSAEDTDMDALFLELDFGDGTAEGLTFLANESTYYEATFTHTYDSPGEFILTVTADDQTGISGHEVEYGPVSFTVLEDTEAPETVAYLNGDPYEDSQSWLVWFGADVDVGLIVTDDGVGVASTEWYLNNGSWTEYDGQVTISAEGANHFAYRSVDLAGNVEETQLATVMIDKTAPSLTLDRDTGFTVTSTTVVITAAYSDALSGVASISVTLDGEEWSDVGFLDGGAEMNITGLSDGDHTLVVKVIDNAGRSTSVTLEFEVERSLFALDGPAGPWIVIGMLAAIMVVIAVAAILLLERKRMAPPA